MESANTCGGVERIRLPALLVSSDFAAPGLGHDEERQQSGGGGTIVHAAPAASLLCRWRGVLEASRRGQAVNCPNLASGHSWGWP